MGLISVMQTSVREADRQRGRELDEKQKLEELKKPSTPNNTKGMKAKDKQSEVKGQQ